ncbi:Cytochrome b561 [Roseivivax lentus]|uniref:Cytochrome b561 n=1 Tax=Roseivivax lentus TaxID=633194 RepID=A0A1N7N065_9RHOB|nr:cytochrome b/b6 domain-containing protein [Roseivivax lentus]SIS91767.1 Cytochrome b561 [Roseivivax lentus]
MPAGNTLTRYGWVAKSFHWIIALGMIANIALGLWAEWLPLGGEDEIALKKTAFSIHKTLGVTILFAAILRVLWAIAQPKPVPLHPERRVETFAAGVAHWLLYGSIILIPLSGWAYHSATTGFAPIWWPLGQSLPFISEDEALAEVFSTLHYLFNVTLWLALAAHILGALKHHIIDRDATLARMLPGRTEAGIVPVRQGHVLPAFAAVAVWAVVLGGAGAAGWYAPEETGTETAALEEVASDWVVEDGTLALSITQNGSEVTGEFADWTADITFEEQDKPGIWGDVTVEVAIASLTLGSVTGQAKGPDFLAAEEHPRARFEADIVKVADGYEARGTLTLKGETAPLTLPFQLLISEDGVAEMDGRLTMDRRTFGVGTNIQDEGQLGFSVGLRVTLTARRQAEAGA